MQESWKDIEGYEGLYQVSNTGKVKSISHKVKFRHFHRLIPERELRLATDKFGYKRVCLTVDNKKYTARVHRLVAIAFIPNSKNLPCVNHLDENKANNNVSNLTWVTYKENSNYGTVKERRVSNFDYASKVKNTDIRAMAKKLKIPLIQKDLFGNTIKIWESGTDAALELNINQGNISSCCNGIRNHAGGYKWEFLKEM